MESKSTDNEEMCYEVRTLSPEDRLKLEKQNTRIVSSFNASKLELEVKKNWDLFYKRNETRFFKDRNWTVREFEELAGARNGKKERRIMLEVGCGVGNLIFPLIDQGLDVFVYACDFSPRAIELLKANPLYNPSVMKGFQADITTGSVLQEVPLGTLDIITMVFVLSAIHPSNFITTLCNMYTLLRPGGVLLFRDYGLYDMAQLRFKAGTKISENFYARQDGTRSYYFSLDEVSRIIREAGFEIGSLNYIHRRTINKKEGLDVPRIFVQGKFMKPENDSQK